MEKRTFNFNEETVAKVLAGRVVVDSVGMCEQAITVGTVSRVKPDGTNFFYEGDEENPYAIVNLQALTSDEMEKAVEFYENGEYQKALQRVDEVGVRNLSVNIPLTELDAKNIAKGMIVKGNFDYRLNREGEEVLVCTSITPIIAKAGRNIFAERASKAKAEALKQSQESKAQAESENA